MKFTEKVNPTKCKYLLTLRKGQFERLFPRSNDDDEKNKQDTSYYSMLSYCKRQREANYALDVEYKRSQRNPYKGRCYAVGVSLQNMRLSLRKFLTEGIYRDFDMKNAHPTFLLHLCEGGVGPPHAVQLLPCESLRYYCENKEQFLQEVGVSKKIMLTLFNKDRTDYMVRNHCSTLREFARELRACKKKLFDYYYPLWRETYHFDPDSKNPISSFLWSMICGNQEDQLLQKVVHKLDTDKVGCLLFDGFLYEDAIEPEFFEGIKEDADAEYGDIEWVEKPNVSTIQIPDALSSLESYLQVKKQFEDENGLYACKIMDPPVFVVRINGDRVFYKKQDFITAFESYNYQTLDKGEIKEECFLRKWFRDADIQVKDKVGLYPERTECPDNIYNIWDDFDVLTWDRSDYKYDEEAVDRFLHHMKLLTNHEEHVYNFLLKWTAHIFQKPHIKPEVCPIMLGLQGTGKDLFFNTLAGLMGQKKRYESASPESEVYGSFNPLLMDALVVQLSEIDKSNTLGHIGHLKSLITSPTVTINDKHKSPVVIPSLHRYAIVSNNEDPITQESKQRRFVCMYGSAEMRGNADYFTRYVRTILEDKNSLMSIYEMLMKVPHVPDKFTQIDQYFSRFQRVMATQNVAYHEGFVKYMVVNEATGRREDIDSVALEYDINDLYTNYFRSYMSDEHGGRVEGYTLKKLRNRLTALSINYSIDVLENGKIFRFIYKSPDGGGLLREFDLAA